MGDDPATSRWSIRWGRAHDVPNLFVVDGSLFVTAGGLNPTSTIGALALRTADHIANSASRQAVATSTPEQRAAFARLADELLPATGDLPAPSTLAIEQKWLDRALATRPDLEADLERALASGATARALHDDDPTAFFALGLMATGAYYLHPRVRRLIGYPGQKPDPRGRRRERLLAARRAARSGHRPRADLAPGVTATRETFAGMGGVEKGIWYLASLLSTGLFAYGIWRLVLRWRSGRGALSRPRVGAALKIVLTHSWVRRRAIVGYAHAGVFYGFLVLFAGTMILAIQDDIARAGLRLRLLARLLLPRLLAVPRRVRACAHRRPARADGSAGDRAPATPRRRTRRWTLTPRLRDRGLGLRRHAALPRRDRLPARVAARSPRAPELREWAPPAGCRPALHDAGMAPQTAQVIHHVSGGCHGLARSRSSRRSRSARACTCSPARPACRCVKTSPASSSCPTRSGTRRSPTSLPPHLLQPRRVHALRKVPRGVPGDERRHAALAA